jgi:O-antigen ligase
MNIIIIIIFLVYFTQSFQIFAVGTYGFTYIDLFLMIFYVVFFKKVFYDGEKLQFSFNYTFILILAFLLLGLISGLTPLFSMDKLYITQFLKTYIHLIYIALFAVICYTYKIPANVWEKIIKMWIVISVIINLYAIYQLFARMFGLPFGWIELSNASLSVRGTLDEEVATSQLALRFKDFYRATSIFSEPSTLAVNNLIMLSFLITPYFQNKLPYIKNHFFNILAVILSVIALFLTYSLTAVLGLALIFAVIFIMFRGKKLKMIFIYILIGAAMIFIANGIIESYTKISVYGLFEKRIASLIPQDKRLAEGVVGDSFGSRAESAEIAIELMERNPLIGIGLGQTQYDPRFSLMYIDFSSFTVLAEMGVPSLVVFTGIFIGVFFHLYRLIKDKKYGKYLTENDQRLLGTMIVAFVVIFQTNFLSANNLITYNFWFFLAMAISLISNMYIKSNEKVYAISLLATSLKSYINKRLMAYQHFRNDSDHE